MTEEDRKNIEEIRKGVQIMESASKVDIKDYLNEINEEEKTEKTTFSDVKNLATQKELSTS